MSTQSARKTGVSVALALPPEVDPAFYRGRWPDLHTLSDDGLVEHYAVFGRNEGRVASPAGERPGFLALVPPKARVLEIGPAHKPCFKGPNVKYFDVQDFDGLRARALTHNENPRGTPGKIDYVSPVGDLGIVRETFDAVFSSHAIEHQPDLIGHLIEVDRLLAPGGAYFVICPDKRYCFDRHIPQSTIGEVLEAHLAGRQTHRMADCIDAMSMSSHNDPARHWANDSPEVGVNAALVAQALEQIDKAKGGYIDCHAWRMTPGSFREILDTLHLLGKSPLRPLRVYDTGHGQNEFFAVLGRRAEEMAKFYDRLEVKHVAFIKAQKMFFVATAPLSDTGRVNLSPKGYDSFRVIGPNRVAYADLGGSGAETLAHVRENGRITFMFCAYEGAANIMRLYGRGEVMQFNDPGFAEEIAKFPPGHERARDIIFADITTVQDSCGWAVPFMDYKGERDQLLRYIENKPLEEWHESRLAKNAQSIDGLPGLLRSKAAK